MNRVVRCRSAASIVLDPSCVPAASDASTGRDGTGRDGTARGFFEFTGAGGAQYFAEQASGKQRRLVYAVPPWIQNAQDEAGFSGVDLAPGGARFATVDPDLGLEVGTDGDNADQVLPQTIGPNADISVLPIWSPDGRDLAVATQNSDGDYTDGLYVVRADSSGYRLVMADELQDSPNSVAWSPNGDKLAIWVQKPPAEQWGPARPRAGCRTAGSTGWPRCPPPRALTTVPGRPGLRGVLPSHRRHRRGRGRGRILELTASSSWPTPRPISRPLRPSISPRRPTVPAAR